MTFLKTLLSLVLFLYLMQSSFSFAGNIESVFPFDCDKILNPNGVRLQNQNPLVKADQQFRDFITYHMNYKKQSPLQFRNWHTPITQKNTIHIFKDDPDDHFYVIEKINPAKSMYHEIRTAHAYAKYLSSIGQSFVFIGEFQDRSVPLFDGITIDNRTGLAIQNISLKGFATPITKTDLKSVLDKLEARMDVKQSYAKNMNAPGWFLASNNLGRMLRSPKDPSFYDWIWHARILAEIFEVPLVNKVQKPNFREMITVVDMRNSGLDYDFFKARDVSDSVQAMVDEFAENNVGLTLIWDSSHVLNF